jgi:hypothetical protein
VVAQEEPVEDDDWEWTIAMARARAAADEVEQQATQWVKPAATAPKKRKTAPGMPAVRAKTEPQPVVAPAVRKTIIPIPSLSLNGQSPLRRAPRGTGPIEDTVRTQPAPPANDDTSPYVTLPAEVRPVGHAHTKRVAAKAR